MIEGSPPTEDASLVRLLGLAFAGADLVFEIDNDGVIVFALGAAERLTGRPDKALVGKDWASLFNPSESALLTRLRKDLAAGERRGPMRVDLAPQDAPNAPTGAGLSVFRLPQLGSKLSCALSLSSPTGGYPFTRDASGFTSVDSFARSTEYLLEEARQAGLVLSLDLVEVRGLRDRLAQLPPEDAEEARQSLQAVLRADSYGGLGGAEVGVDRFAVMRSSEAPPERLLQSVGAATGGAIPQLARMPLDCAATSRNMRTMRLALDRFIEAGSDAAAAGFSDTVARTLRDSSRFRDIVEQSGFQLAYQPVVSLETGRLHHFEALARFSPDTSPAETIQLAEDLDMIQAFDLSVVRSIVRELEAQPRTTRIAANLSAHSLMIDGFLEEILGLVSDSRDLRRRLILEITETRKIQDLDRANSLIALLRKAGHIVCLDDFGAGAASLDYLRRLEVDFIKIDGRYIQSMTEGSRDALVVKHLVALCKELGVATIAEMIETTSVARLSQELGVELGQGWAFSKPLDTPKWSPQSTPKPARGRVGAREIWI
ncbi:MAG: EAL domain-containing protein [Phenylobacterium sp.]|jgi:EAL domain-containing protein (putative c-di-GMP-specific phosphodiesterase class I)|uniref:sensor domain-containing phosphodiesterase n=1 Tax=Phenylobacterium sp. TaxID=1871053 RepID=UPI0025FA02B2|nr:EAL domain-containing protein [Phenylobacterium sp.]MCA4915836.1 EAL domain-containing protein [Phenylobacterium sp.]MCA6253949.1 EAL domain-containing protein [Phenylobacterium sp.]